MASVPLDRRLTQTLLQLELEREWQLLMDKNKDWQACMLRGHATTSAPWLPWMPWMGSPPTAATTNVSTMLCHDSSTDSLQELPLLDFVIRGVIQPFPLIRGQSREQQARFWQMCQVLLDSWAARLPLTWTPPSTSQGHERRLMLLRFKNGITRLATVMIHGPDQMRARINGKQDANGTEDDDDDFDDHDDDDDDDELGSYSGSDRVSRGTSGTNMAIRVVSAVCSTEKRKKKTYFIIDTTVNQISYRVARQHRDFVQLAKQLQSAFGKKEKEVRLPSVPAKIYTKQQRRSLSTSHRRRRHSDALPWADDDRRCLNAYLAQLTANAVVAQHPLVRQFLTEPIATTQDGNTHGSILALVDDHDILCRQALDHDRREHQRRIDVYMDHQRNALDAHLDALMDALAKPHGCRTLLDQIKATPNPRDLPIYMQKCFEWGKLCFAFALHHQLVLSEWATENRRQFKNTHGLIPYRMAAAILRIGNPMTMMKAMLSLFLARPFGQQSLMQRTIVVNLQEEMVTLTQLIQNLEKELPDPFCERLYQATYTERVEGMHGPLPWDDENGDDDASWLEFVLLRLPCGDDGDEGRQRITQMMEVDLDAPTRARLQQLWHLYAEQRELAACIDMLTEPATGELLQTLATMMYEPLAHVYQAADLGTTLGHVQSFMNDIDHLIDLVEKQTADQQHQGHANVHVNDSENGEIGFQAFLQVVDRHQDAFYQFVRKVHTQTKSPFFTDLIDYVDQWLARLKISSKWHRQWRDTATQPGASTNTPSAAAAVAATAVGAVDAMDNAAQLALPALSSMQTTQLRTDLDMLKQYDQARHEYKMAKKLYKMRLPTTQDASRDNASLLQRPTKPSPPHRSKVLPLLLPSFLKHIVPILQTA
ncbi:hypothetical protein BC940DRAFT_306481 [Gongronella butleri]|nr:hypothetical protein BC940DRAFT_306481 [Gongronella butleri]